MSEIAGIPVVAAPVHARAVCFTGDNLEEVRTVVLASLYASRELPEGYDMAIGWPEHSNPTAIKVWDFRSERWAYAMPGDWIIVFDTGVLVLDQWWYRTLFASHTAEEADRLSRAAELAAQLQELLALREEPPRAAPVDSLSAVNLRQVPQHYAGPPMQVPVVGDIWRDTSGKTWTVHHVPDDEWWTADCRDEEGLRWFWSVLWQYYAPLTLIHRAQVSTAA